MFLKINTLAAAAALLLIPAAALADTFSLDFNVVAQVPAADSLSISPVNNWTSTAVSLGYDATNRRVNSVSNNIVIRSTVGDVTAYLVTAPALQHASDATASIPLTITVNNKALKVGAAAKETVATKAEASSANGLLAPVLVSPTNPATAYTAGGYAGNVQMMFESVAPAP